MKTDNSPIFSTDQKTEPELPKIDCVVIGVNCAATLRRCLNSITHCNYPQELLSIYYVDGGSSDNSTTIAESVTGVQTIYLTPRYPTPGLGRNSGWQAGNSPLIQFLDSDTILEPDWLTTAVKNVQQKTGAVTGNRKELHPNHSTYNWIGSLEWNGKPGLCESFGGDVLIQRQVLEQTGGYDEVLVGGEDPELSCRIRKAGWSILQLGCDMTYHDLAMTRFSQYWKRSYRSGYGFAAVITKCSGDKSNFWYKEYRRIIVRGGGGIGAFLAATLLYLFSWIFVWLEPGVFLFLATSILLIFFPRLFRVQYFSREKQLESSLAKTYAWHCSVAVIPQFMGVARYFVGQTFSSPLRNTINKLGTTATGK